MGFLNYNSTCLGSNVEFPVVEGYCGSVGAALAAVEGQQNDFAMFEAALTADFQEAVAVREGTDIEPLQEASIGGFFSKVIEFFKKLGAKIKAIFTAFCAKLDSYLQKDAIAFVKKYRPVLIKKATFSKMKAKYATPKNGYEFTKAYPAINITGSGEDKEFDREDYIDELCKDVTGSTCSLSELPKEIHDSVYGDEEVKDNWSLSDLQTIMNRLENSKKTVEGLKKTSDNLQTTIKRVIADIEKQQKIHSNGIGKDLKANYSENIGRTISGDPANKSVTRGDKVIATTGAEGTAKMQRLLSNLQAKASCHQSVILKFSSSVMNEAKWGIAQDKRIIATAVAYNAKTVKEDAELLEAIGECAQAECEMAFDEMEVA